LTPKEAMQSSPFPDFHPRVTSQNISQCSPKTTNIGDLVLEPGSHTGEVLREIGLTKREIQRLSLDGAFGERAQRSARIDAKL